MGSFTTMVLWTVQRFLSSTVDFPFFHVGSLRALNEVFYQIITTVATVVWSEGTAKGASLRRFDRRSYGYKVFGTTKLYGLGFSYLSFNIFMDSDAWP